jgi:hypothetical protein
MDARVKPAHDADCSIRPSRGGFPRIATIAGNSALKNG